MKSYFPKAVSYNRFVELESRVFFQLMFFLNLGTFGICCEFLICGKSTENYQL